MSFPTSSEIVEFCAIECELQRSGERSVSHMVRAWNAAQSMDALEHLPRLPTVDEVIALGRMVEPTKNARGLRTCGVRVGLSIKPDHREVPRLLDTLCDTPGFVSAADWFYEYEEIHPFVDGNGRTGQILFNWLKGTLHEPKWAPNFWDDPRRHGGYGA